MRTLVLEARRFGAAEYGIISRLTDDNYLFRAGKIDEVELVNRAEAEKIRWESRCPHMFEVVKIAFSDDAPSPARHILTGQSSEHVAQPRRVRHFAGAKSA